MLTDLFHVTVVLNHDVGGTDGIPTLTVIIPIISELDEDDPRLEDPDAYEAGIQDEAVRNLKGFLNNHAHLTATILGPVFINKAKENK